METYRREYAAELEKGNDGQPDKIKAPEYSQDDELFMTLVKTLSLSTTTKFQFDPKDEEIKAWYNRNCKKLKTKGITFPKDLGEMD